MTKQKLTKGLFISFEGGEGSGKSTQIKQLARTLIKEGYSVRCVREPGGSKISEAIRKIILDPANTAMTERAEALLFAAGRAQLIEEVYQPLLTKGTIILADRYVDSSYVYQGVARGLGLRAIELINDFAIAGLLPDLTFLLDLPYQKGHARRHATSKIDRLDREKKSFHKAVERGYHEIAKKFRPRIVTIDASRGIEPIHQEIYKRTKKLIKKVS